MFKKKHFVSYAYFPDKNLIKVFKFENDPSTYEAKPYESDEKIYLFEEDYFISKKNNKLIKNFIKKIKKNNEIVNYLTDLEDLRKFTETSIKNMNVYSKKYLTCKPIFIY